MYKILKSFLLVILTVSMSAFALNDAEEMEFVGAVNEGDMKIVKRYVETMNVNIEDSYFAWTPFLMTAAKKPNGSYAIFERQRSKHKLYPSCNKI
jgi:hypothetical protein